MKLTSSALKPIQKQNCWIYSNKNTPTWMSWYTKSDQYSRQKLTADLEKLRSFYQDRGYLDYAIDSTQVSISPDKENIYLTITQSEGNRYLINNVK